jgi:hypothetical protein
MVALGVISFALLSILGLMTISMTVHQDASSDSVLSLMTESALQEVRNYNAPTVNLSGATSPYSFAKLAPPYTGYIYFDADGQITMDGYRVGATITPSSTSSGGIQSTDVGIPMNSPTLNASNTGNASVPLTAATTTLPTGTYYTCKITTLQPVLFNGTSTPSMIVIKLTFSWLGGTAGHSRTIFSSLSNNAN